MKPGSKVRIIDQTSCWYNVVGMVGYGKTWQIPGKVSVIFGWKEDEHFHESQLQPVEG